MRAGPCEELSRRRLFVGIADEPIPSGPECRMLARTGPGVMSDLSPLSGVERKLDFGAVRSPFDPTETSSPINCPRPGVSFLTHRPVVKCYAFCVRQDRL